MKPARLFTLLALLLADGCVSDVAANATADFLAEAAPAARAYFDYETAGIAAANGLVQLEGLHRVSPGNARLTLTLAQGYVAYAFGWVMDRQEEAQFSGRDDDAEHEKQRAFLMYSRAHELTLRLMRARDPAIDGYFKGDPDKLATYLRRAYAKHEDVELVFWAALCWGSTITNAPSLDALVDLATVKVLAQHAVTLDEKYEHAGALVVLGGFEASYPRALGGNWEKGRAYFERALALSGRRDHLVLINYARTYAVNAQDKALFVKLMHEVIESSDRGEEVRLSNKVARRRAQRYLAHLDDLFAD